MKKVYLFLIFFGIVGLLNAQNCNTIMSTDIRSVDGETFKPIPATGSEGTAYSVLVAPEGIISDINVVNLAGEHTWISDLEFILESPQGTSVTLISHACDKQDNFNVNLDESGVDGLPCPYTDGGTYKTQNSDGTSLTDFIGENSEGTWTLTIIDNSGWDRGYLHSWGLEICVSDCQVVEVDNEVGKCGANVNFDIPVVDGAVVTQEDGSGLTSGSFFPVGTTLLGYRIDDGGEVTSTCIAVTVNDAELPTASCQDVTVQLDASGNATVAAMDVDNGSTDNCALEYLLDVSTFTGDDVGDQMVTLTVTDSGGNTDECTATVTVEDNIDPIVTCVPALTLPLDDSGNAFITAVDILDMGSDGGGTPDYTLDNSIFDCSDVGDHTITLTATDGSGNSAQCQTTVTVVDDSAPALSAVEDVVVELEPGVCESEIDYPEIKVTDNCGAMLEQIAGLGPDGIFPVGTSAEIWQATDNSGNVDVISFNVIVTSVDGPPTIDTLEDIIVTEATSMVLVPLTGISSGEDCEPQDVEVIAKGTNTDLVTSVTVNYEGGSTGSLELTLAPETEGTSEITVTVGDSGGATTERTFKVTVDTQNNPPFVLNPVADQVVNASYVLKVPISSAAGEIFDDIDDDNLTLAVMEEGAETLPSWATYEGDTLVCSPMIADTGCVNIVVQATDADGATASDTFQVCVDGYPTSIGEMGSGEFEVQMYPNPSTGIVNLDINTSAIHDVDLAVMDITGREVLRKQYSAAQTIRFDMSGKVSGMYFVHLNIEGKQIIKKLVVDGK